MTTLCLWIFFFILMPAYCLCLTQKNTTPHVQRTLKQSEEISSMWRKKNRGTLQTHAFILSLFLSFFFLKFSSVWKELTLWFCTAALDHKLKLTSAAVLQGSCATWCTIQKSNTYWTKWREGATDLLFVLFADVNIGGDVVSSLCTTTPSVWLVRSSSTRL